jgi:hypothetical protein
MIISTRQRIVWILEVSENMIYSALHDNLNFNIHSQLKRTPSPLNISLGSSGY